MVDRSNVWSRFLRLTSSGAAQPPFEETTLFGLTGTFAKRLHLRAADAEDRVRPTAFTRRVREHEAHPTPFREVERSPKVVYGTVRIPAHVATRRDRCAVTAMLGAKEPTRKLFTQGLHEAHLFVQQAAQDQPLKSALA